MLSLVKVIFPVVFLLNSVWAQDSSCDSGSCRECIQELNCAWCITPTVNGSRHCIQKSAITEKWCNSSALIVDPQSSWSILKNDPLSSDEGKAVQISPQRLKLKLRRGESYVLNFQYAQAANYPVDLYYMMDLSASMEEHREKLGKLGVKLAETMRTITNDFRLGFGSFVDKVELPFVSTVPSKLTSPCTLNKNGKSVKCEAPYSYRNSLNLTSNYQEFAKKVTAARASGNLDAPEGGFDALMQAMVCKDVIGWRDQARHLLVFSTDADFHIAGDGKLAGAVEPNDAQCHMRNNEYVDALIYDYPSVSQINYVAKQKNINIIFAIVNKRWIVDSYRRLSERIENSNTGALDERSENVVNLVLDNYKKIVNSVSIAVNSSKDVEVKISSVCPHPTESGCTDIHVGEIVNFTATIKPLSCTKGSTKTISIKPEAIDESIIVELEVICDCECEGATSEFFKPRAQECTKFGDLECGACHCDSGRFGRNCECDESTSDSLDTKDCKKSEDDEKDCSGLGKCKCGKCDCNKRLNPLEEIDGTYCQCDNYSCPQPDGVLCSNRGKCVCRKCECYAGWTGEACDCPAGTKSCMNPRDKNQTVCSGVGTCNCGKCDCIVDNHRYHGKYCEECLTCPAQRCDELRHCVECQVHKSGIYDDVQCRTKCTSFIAEHVKKIDETSLDEDVKICRIPDKNGCTFKFQYKYLSKDEVLVKAEENKVCNPPPNILAWIFGVIGTIVAAGLIILLIWKISTTIHDRREYAKFENERQNMRWNRNDNPLYKQATSTFANPVYNRGSNRYSFKNKEPSSP